MKFTIRDLFLVTLIVALAVGWWVERSRYSQADREILDQIRNARTTSGDWKSYPPSVPTSSAPAPNPPKP